VEREGATVSKRCGGILPIFSRRLSRWPRGGRAGGLHPNDPPGRLVAGRDRLWGHWRAGSGSSRSSPAPATALHTIARDQREGRPVEVCRYFAAASGSPRHFRNVLVQKLREICGSLPGQRGRDMFGVMKELSATNTRDDLPEHRAPWTTTVSSRAFEAVIRRAGTPESRFNVA